MKIEICTNNEEWVKGLKQQENGEFLQSSDWGEFQTSIGNKAVRLVGEGWQVQGFEHDLGLGMKYLYVPRVRSSEFLVQSLKDFLNKQKYIFVRIEFVGNYELRTLNSELVKNRQPQQTLIIDLNKPEEELLNEMHSKTRYNIRLAEKSGVEIREEKDVEVFWKLNQETVSRDDFKSHGKDYYKKMLSLDIAHQLTAYYNGEPIASNILVACGETITYLHGASSNNSRNLMAPYLLQFTGMKLGKKLNCRYYDFWGIAPVVAKDEGGQSSCFHNLCWEVNHKWSGVTRFKAGFGGIVKVYPEACDIILKAFYYKLYKLVRKIRGLN